MVLPDEWLMILISTLPAKGEESLDLQSPLTASQLDNRISTPIPDQLVGSDDRHGYLTGRCGRYVAHRQRSHTLCLLMAHQHGAPTPCPFESGCLVLRHQGRIYSTNLMDSNTRLQIENLSAEYIYAAKNYSTSYLSMFLDDAQRIASQLLRLGVSDEMLDEIWYKYN